MNENRGEHDESEQDDAEDAEDTPAELISDLELTLERFDRGLRTEQGYEPVILVTSRGDIETHYYPAASPAPEATPAASGAIFLGDLGGGFDAPGRGRMYPELCAALSARGVAGLRVRYRHPGEFEECVLDVLAALAFLDEQDVGPVALTGHGFGGPIAIHAAVLSPEVVTCVALSTMPYGTDEALALGPRCSAFFAHGTADDVWPADGSREAFAVASEPKKLLLKDGVGHDLDEWADELPAIVRDWIVGELERARPAYLASLHTDPPQAG